MDPFSIGGAIFSGLVATAIMTAVVYVIRGALPQHMPLDVVYMLGALLTRDDRRAYITGAVLHLVAGAIFGLIYAALYQYFGIQSNLYLWGILLGAIHWLFAGVGIGVVGAVHPMIANGQIAAPGFFVRNLPLMTVVLFLVVHVVFGIVNGAVYGMLR